MDIKDILKNEDPLQLKALFGFDHTYSDAQVIKKFNLWGRKYVPQYFSSKDAAFHANIDLHNLQAYRGTINQFVDIAFRGAAKTARTKVFMAFCICNDLEHSRRYIKVLSEDDVNSTQIVTDIYNILVIPKIKALYPEIWQTTEAKREKTMAAFTTSTGVKLMGRTIIADKRGGLQEESRPDLILFEDFENRTTLRSSAKTWAIWENMEEARTGLALGGACIYNCNYISEQGSVHRLITEKLSEKKVVLIQPILDENNVPTWDRYSMEVIEQMKIDDEDFQGERMCKPDASKDIYFDREMLDKQVAKMQIRDIAGFKIFKLYDASHMYGSGHDVGGGVGLDSSTTALYDFSMSPAQVVGTFKSNTIKPEPFGYEIQKETDFFGACIAGVENNYGASAITIARQQGVNLYKKEKKSTKVDLTKGDETEYGWNTNSLTKPQMLQALGKAIVDGLIEFNDADLIAELKSYTRNDLIEMEKDPRKTTRHFDMVMAAAIGWQMRNFATVSEKEEEYEEEEADELLYPSIGM